MRGTVVWEGVERQGLRRRSQRMDRAQPGQRPDPSQPAGTDRLPQIKHIVVLMMENHSFDNYLGTLGRGEGFPPGDDGHPAAENPDASGRAVRAYHMASTVQQPGVPCQSWSAAHTQFADGKMTGFVTATQEAAPTGRQDGGHGLLDRGGPAVLPRPGPHVPAGRSLVQLVPGPDVPEPPLPAGRNRARADG